METDIQHFIFVNLKPEGLSSEKTQDELEVLYLPKVLMTIFILSEDDSRSIREIKYFFISSFLATKFYSLVILSKSFDYDDSFFLFFFCKDETRTWNSHWCCALIALKTKQWIGQESNKLACFLWQ